MSQLLDEARRPVAGAAAPARHGRALEVRGLTKMFTRGDGTVVPAIDGTDLDVAAGEFLVLLGPSGCGKSTFLRCIAGLETPEHGSITMGSRALFDDAAGVCLPPERRGVSMVFQSYALWPHMSVFKNVAYPLTVDRSARPPKAEIARRVREALALVGIEHLAEQFPAQTSGGQQQRVALARALVQGSDIVLFDEPLSNVDARVRDQLRTEIREMQQRIGFTAIYVTHDQEEAMSMADRIAVIDRGAVAHLGTPREVFLEPATLQVARFVGNLVEVEGVVARIEDTEVTLSTSVGEVRGVAASSGIAVGDQASATWRPDRTRLDVDAAGPNAWQGEVVTASFLGSFNEVAVRVGEQLVTHRCPNDSSHAPGDRVTVTVAPTDVRVLLG